MLVNGRNSVTWRVWAAPNGLISGVPSASLYDVNFRLCYPMVIPLSLDNRVLLHIEVDQFP